MGDGVVGLRLGLGHGVVGVRLGLGDGVAGVRLRLGLGHCVVGVWLREETRVCPHFRSGEYDRRRPQAHV